ncbi:cysteine-rich repeat secretory protein 38-like, partial [Chenopodium quinoa]
SSTAGNFTPNSVEEKNVNTLMGLLPRNLSPWGFSSALTRTYPSMFFGIAQCRGDVNSLECNKCVVNASIEIRKSCPYNKGAVIWYDNCMLKYLDRCFFGQINNKNKFYLLNVANLSNDPVLFNTKVKGLLSKLAIQGASTRKLYAIGETKLDTFTNLYGLAQCNQDLSNKVCKTCLDQAISELPNCCDGKRGWRVVSGSCNVRYEICPFINS